MVVQCIVQCIDGRSGLTVWVSVVIRKCGLIFYYLAKNSVTNPTSI